MEVLRTISFKINTTEKQIEFSGVGLTETETEKLVDAFSAVLTEDMAYRMTHNESLEVNLEPFRNFFPSELEQQEAEKDHPQNEYYQDTGIKYKRKNGDWQPTYRLRYVCTNPTCNNKGTHFVPEGTKTVKCHNCKERMDVREATSIGFPNKDSYNNFYHAGDEV